MRQYKEYMDRVKVSDTLHRRLSELEGPGKRPIPWKRYGTWAAALVLVCGLGGVSLWAARANSREAPLPPYAPGYQGVPEIGVVGEPDIAPEEPGGSVEPAPCFMAGSYEVTRDGVTAHYLLPYIEYGETAGVETALDWDVPPGAVKRELTGEEIAALMGGEDVLADHLDWGVEYVLTGWAAWNGDGSFWGAYIDGIAPNYGAALNSFEFAVTAGQLPPTCIAYPGSVEQSVSGAMVTADKHDWENRFGEETAIIHDRRVSFMKDGCGFRFDLSGADAGLAEQRVSRLVRWVLDGGLALDALSSDGAVPAHPWEADPGYSVGEPNWDDSGEGRVCPECGAELPRGKAHDHTLKAVPEADSALTCRSCGGGIPDGARHSCADDPAGSGGHVCGICGQVFPEGKVHSHEYEIICGLPLAPAPESPAPETWTCETCGESFAYGTSHDCGMCDGYPPPHVCEVCGEAYLEGTAHACRQGGHHQEEHHGNHY